MNSKERTPTLKELSDLYKMSQKEKASQMGSTGIEFEPPLAKEETPTSDHPPLELS